MKTFRDPFGFFKQVLSKLKKNLKMFDDYHPNRFGPGRSAVMCKHGAVATSQPLAAQAGLQILRDGGNSITSMKRGLKTDGK